jgi:hypothetical protein
MINSDLIYYLLQKIYWEIINNKNQLFGIIIMLANLVIRFWRKYMLCIVFGSYLCRYFINYFRWSLILFNFNLIANHKFKAVSNQ